VYDNQDRIVFYNRQALEVYGLVGTDISGWGPEKLTQATRGCFKDPGTASVITRIISDHDSEGPQRVTFEVVRPRRRVIERVRALVKMPDGSLFGQVVLYHDLLPQETKAEEQPPAMPARTARRRRSR